MDYYSILNLNREPFSNSPDPEFFYQSRQHQGCLQKIELSIRLKRGLCVVAGDVGTGKSTLCRELIRRFSDGGEVGAHLVLDPLYPGDVKFLAAVSECLTAIAAGPSDDEWTLKERIKKHLFAEGVEKKRTVVLIIDEGQKIAESCLEYLREFLNYETNDSKLLQIVIFAQSEFIETIRKHPNFADRINLFLRLGPLNSSDTARMVRFRMNRCGNSSRVGNLFSPLALWAVHMTTQGYPRRIIHLCHKCLLAMIIQNKRRIGPRIVLACARHQRQIEPSFLARRRVVPATVFFICMAFVLSSAHWLRGYFATPDSVPVSSPADVVSSGAVSTPPGPESGADAIGTAGVFPRLSPPAGGQAAGTENESFEVPSPEKAFLGSLAVGQGESLGRMVQRVYGFYDPAFLRALLAENPEVRNPDSLRTGQVLRFPAIVARVATNANRHYWIEIAQTGTLEKAYAILKKYPADAPPVRMIAYQTEGEETIKFRLITKSYFTYESEAKNLLASIPRENGYTAALFSGWPPGTRFYSDPYRGADSPGLDENPPHPSPHLESPSP